MTNQQNSFQNYERQKAPFFGKFVTETRSQTLQTELAQQSKGYWRLIFSNTPTTMTSSSPTYQF
ncbi:MAG: hypothetical protein COY74_00510 [Nitrosopumilales archaeon CG_4_10_14_0_8_um_filter_34_8]|nr:MAG: hypothetical protein COY74_00510 [Nitrosopumilales archaeon CG_4_10_14_0_8_um_filter_34_8]